LFLDDFQEKNFFSLCCYPWNGSHVKNDMGAVTSNPFIALFRIKISFLQKRKK